MIEAKVGFEVLRADTSVAISALDRDVLDAIRGDFDADFYLARYLDVLHAEVDPLVHYTLWGWRELRDPNPNFSTRHYLQDHPSVKTRNLNPLWHFVYVGRPLGWQPSPPEDTRVVRPDWESPESRQLIRPYFDAAYYQAAHPLVVQAGIDPLCHYFHFGWKEGLDPSPSFSTRGYLEVNRDVADARVNPLWHYAVAGHKEGRQWKARVPAPTPAPDSATPANAPAATPTKDQIRDEIAAIRPHFDTAFYLRKYPDIAAAGVDPVEHFVVAGWKEGRDPHPAFSVTYYNETNPDIQSAGVNPYWHYVVAGKAEGRKARHPGGHIAEALMELKPLEDRVRAWKVKNPPDALLSADDLIAAIRTAADGASALMLSIGHDNYRKVPGGVQYCIQKEEEIATARGILYINLHPFQPLPRLAHLSETPDALVVVMLAGTPSGVAQMSAVIAAVAALRPDFPDTRVVIHHLLGHNPEQVTDLVLATGQNRADVWAHDFFTLCPSFTLQRNAVTFCGAPAITSNACQLCLYGVERAAHQARIAALFDALSIRVIAPSRFAADFWAARSDLKPAAIAVAELMSVTWAQAPEPSAQDSGPITVAFVGYPAPHKGWPAFQQIVHRHGQDDARFRFLYFGTADIGMDRVESFPVQVTADDPDAMIRALAAQKVDFVLHWATWAETFSYSTHEALAAGAFVLTNPISGNVAVTVQRLGKGVVLRDEADLMAFFDDGRALDLVASLRDIRRGSVAAWTRNDITFSARDLGASA